MLLSLTPGFAQEVIPRWAREVNAKWFAALQAADAAALARLYTEDAVSVTPSRVLRGRAAIEAFHRSNFEKSRPKCTWSITGAQALDKLAAVWGKDTCTETPTSGAKPWTSQTRWLTVYELQPDGQWLVVRESYDLVKP
jgi:uncharacterized protein (TIGR02246 family)